MSHNLIIGLLDKDWDNLNNPPYFQGRTRHIDLDIPSVENAHKIAELAGVTSYIISPNDDWTGRKRAFATLDITAWENKRKAEREKEIKDKTELCARINKLPTTYPYGIIAGHKISFERGVAEYDPRKSSNIQWGLSILFLKIGAVHKHEYFESLYPSQYRSSGHGARLHKKFENDMKRRIEDQTERNQLWDELPKIEERYAELKQQIENA